MKNSLQTGHVILVKNHFVWWKPASWMYFTIRMATGGNWNHCALAFVSADGQLSIIEATGKGVIETDYLIWEKRSLRTIEVIPISCSPDQITIHLGKKYDHASLLLFCLIKIISKKWLGKKDAAADDKLYCFELAALVHHLPDWWGILPGECEKYLKYKVNQMPVFSMDLMADGHH